MAIYYTYIINIVIKIFQFTFPLLHNYVGIFTTYYINGMAWHYTGMLW